MVLKFIAGMIGVGLVLVFLAPPVLKLKDLALSGVCLIGVTMMLIDFWHSLREADE